jgi:hypothetical protein
MPLRVLCGYDSLVDDPTLIPASARSRDFRLPLIELGVTTIVLLTSLMVAALQTPTADAASHDSMTLVAGSAIGVLLLLCLIRAVRDFRFGAAIPLIAALGIDVAVLADAPFNSILGLFSDCWLSLVVAGCLIVSAMGGADAVFFSLRRSPERPAGPPLARFLAGCVLVLVLAWALAVNETRREDARAWCDRAFSTIELWHSDHGRYPRDVAEAGIDDSQAPRRVRSRVLYYSDRDGFLIGFVTDVFGNSAEVREVRGSWRPYQLGL